MALSGEMIGVIIGTIGVLLGALRAWLAIQDRKDKGSANYSNLITLDYRRHLQYGTPEIVTGDDIGVRCTVRNCSARLFLGEVNESLPEGAELIAGQAKWSGRLLPGQATVFEYTIRVYRAGLMAFREPTVKLEKHKESRLTVQCDEPTSVMVRTFTPAKLSITARISETPVVLNRPFLITLVWRNEGSEGMPDVSYRFEYDMKVMSLLERDSDFDLGFAMDRQSEVKQTLSFVPSELGEIDVQLTDIEYRSIEGNTHKLRDHAIHLTVGLGWHLILVDRHIETRHLRNFVDNLKNGQGHLTILQGEAGIGKSHLIRDLTAYARDKDCQCYLTACMEFNCALPFHPFHQFLDDISFIVSQSDIHMRGASTTHEPPTVSEALKPYITGLVDYLAGVNRNHDERSELVASPRELRGQFFIALWRILEALSSMKPVVLCIEDIQWADSGTLDALMYLTTKLEETPIYIVSTLRGEVLQKENGDPNRSSLHALLSARRRDICEVLKLAPFSIHEVTELLERVFCPSEFSSQFIASIYEETDGNPFYIHEVVELMLRKGIVRRRSANEKWTADESVEEGGVPDGIDHTVRTRLASLTEPQFECLRNTSVIGRQFDYVTIEHVTDLKEDELVDFIDKCVGMGIIEEVDAANRRYRFLHNKMRQVIYEGITATRKMRIHGKIAKALEEVHSDSLYSLSAVIADHYLKAGELRLSVKHLLLAGKENLRVFNNREAIRYLINALHILSEIKEEDAELRRDILLGLADAYREDNDFSKAERVYDVVLDIAKKTGDRELMCILLSRKAEANAVQGKYEIAEEVYNEFRSLLDSTDDDRKTLLLLNDQADLYYWLYKKSIVGKNITLANSYRDKIYQDAVRALEIAGRLDDLDGKVRSMKNIGIYHLIIQNYGQAIRHFEEAKHLAETYRLLRSQYVYAFAGLAHRLLGNNDDAMGNYSKYLAWAERIGAHWAQSKGHQIIGLMSYLRGDLEGALASLDKALELNSIVKARHEDIETLIVKGQVLEDLGRERDALDCYKASLALKDIPADNMDSRSSMMLDIGLEMYSRGEIEQSRKFLERATKGVVVESTEHELRVLIGKLGIAEPQVDSY